MIDDGEIHDVLRNYGGLSLGPSRSSMIRLVGPLEFSASFEGWSAVDKFNVEIGVPHSFPSEIPTVCESSNRIPKTPDYHVNSDGTFCLGSTLGLKKLLYEDPTLLSFIDKAVVGYLFNVSVKLDGRGDFVTGSLAHGIVGLFEDYGRRFQLRTPQQVVSTLRALSRRKRVANKQSCPCDCGERLGRCRLAARVNQYRPVASRSWFARHAADLNHAIRR